MMAAGLQISFRNGIAQEDGSLFLSVRDELYRLFNHYLDPARRASCSDF
jgi:hypothetical protein